jgi:deoxyribodipyrimidine photo-lyase
MKKIILVWHRRDLRIHDNRALYEACQEENTIVIPLFIFDPHFFGEDKLDSNSRIIFMKECLDDLSKSYKKIGLDIHYYYGKSVEMILKLQKNFKAKVYYNLDTAMNYGFKRDEGVKDNEMFFGYQNDAIIREGNSRTNWGEQAQQYFESYLYSIDESKKYIGFIQTKKVNPSKILEKFSITHNQNYPIQGGETIALERLEEFMNKSLSYYPGAISKPKRSQIHCSRLSAHLSLGAISPKKIYDEVNKTNLPYKTKHFYLTRLFWREHFTQKLQDYPNAQEVPINPICKVEREENQEYVNAYINAQTGFPIIDAAIISLKKTGWLNFRSRAMLASFFCLILRQNWKIGADFMHRHLIDADIAINYQQWQMQAGLVGVHPLRIYNPKKMIEEHDPECTFVKENLPLFKDVKEIAYICEPWKYTYQLKSQYGIEVGNHYPKPIIKFEEEAKKTRALVKEKLDKIRESLGDPNFLKKASLSKSPGRFSKRTTKTKIGFKEEKPKQKTLGGFL